MQVAKAIAGLVGAAGVATAAGQLSLLTLRQAIDLYPVSMIGNDSIPKERAFWVRCVLRGFAQLHGAHELVLTLQASSLDPEYLLQEVRSLGPMRICMRHCISTAWVL